MNGALPRKRPLGGLTITLMFFWLTVCLLPAAAWGKPATPGQVRQVVQNWLSLSPMHLGATLALQVKEVQAFPDNSGGTAYYAVYLDPVGLVIVSGDDLVEPIIGFLPEATSYDPSADNPLGALVSRDLPGRVARVRELEQQAQQRGLAFTPRGSLGEAQRKWASLENPPANQEGLDFGLPTDPPDVRVAPLTQSKWDQKNVGGQACYNYNTPPYSAGSPSNYYAGCVATAMAQLMRFHQYPTTGVSGTFTITVDGNPQTASLRGGNGSGGPYNWSSMVLVPTSGINTAQRQAIGALTYDAGVSVNMDYASTGSGTNTLNAATAFKNTFGYGNAIKGYNGGGNIPSASLNPMVNPNLDAGFPVVFGITGSSGGHAIVGDGYGYSLSTLYHHLNMGWSGYDNAWYNLPNIDSSPSFTTVYRCIYNVFPSGSGEIISGRVLDAGGNPLSGATVSATGGGHTYNAVQATGSSGVYAIPHVPSGAAVTVSATKTGYTFTSQAVTTGTSTDYSSTTGNRWGIDFQAGAVTIPLNTALDNATLAFTTGGSANWYGEAATFYYGGSAAQSGKIAANQVSWLQTSVTGPGTMTFYFKVSSENNYDWLRWYLDGTKVDGWSGEKDWTQFTLNVPAGTHTIKWQYEKNASIDSGSDCGWVDKVVYSGRGQGSITPILTLLLLQ